jgi:uncharacterized protein YndB with AHSA1/START domain
MSRVVASIDLSVPPQDVWDVVMDPARLGDWVTIHRKASPASAGPMAEGAKLDQVLVLRGTPFKVHWTVVEADPPRVAVWEGRGPARSKARTAYRLSPDGNGGTRFDYENDFEAPFGPLGAVASQLLVGGISERETKASLRRLQALLAG